MTYEVVAQNYSQASDNKIHSDEVARKYGFTGALVPGVAVFGHAVHPLVTELGEAWLNSSTSALRLYRPAYHGDTLSVEYERLSTGLAQDAQHWPGEALADLSSVRARGELLATVHSRLNDRAPPPLPTAASTAPTKLRGQSLMQWDTVVPGEPFNPWEWHIEASENNRYCGEVADQQPLYERYAHPHWLLSIANTALTLEYDMPAWIHVGSELCIRRALHVGDRVTVNATPVEKWERKGHQFVRLQLQYWRGDEVTTEIMHTAIFRIAP